MKPKENREGIPWWSSGKDSALSLLRARVQSLVRELRSCKPCSVAKKEKKERKQRKSIHAFENFLVGIL